MMADGGSAVLNFIRWWDNDTHDAADICHQISILAGTLDWFFNDNKCLTFELGYTKMMINHLKRSRAVLVRGKSSSIGGFPLEAIIQQALQIMRLWVVVLLEVLKAEFPAWHILRAFSVLKLLEARCEVRGARLAALQRFSQVFGINLEDLHEDVKFALPDALRIKHANRQMSNFDVWKSTVDASQGSARELNALRRLLIRYGSYSGCTTSGVERVHSDQDWLFTKRRGAMTSASENVEIKLVVDRPSDDSQVTDALFIAQWVWTLQFGSPRAHTHLRRDSGKAHGGRQGTLAHFTARRAHALHAEVEAASLDDVHKRSLAKTGDALPEKLLQEIEFNKAKGRVAKLEALPLGLLLPSEYSANDMTEASELRDHYKGLKRTRLQCAAKSQSKMKRASTFDFKLKTAYIDPRCTAVGYDSPQTLCLDRDMRVLIDKADPADVYIVNQPGSLDLVSEAIMVLGGGLVCDVAYLASGGATGSCVMYNSSTLSGCKKRPRWWWASTAFKGENAVAYDALHRLTLRPSSVWKEAINYEQWADKAAAHVGAGRLFQAFVLISRQQAAAGAQPVNFVTLSGLVTKFRSIDVQRSSVGVLGA